MQSSRLCVTVMEGGGGPLALPLGFMFQPTDVELIEFYLRPRLLSGVSPPRFLIQEADIYQHHPSELSALVGNSFVYRRENEEMYFFTPRHLTGCRAVAEGSGLWEGRARDIPIMSSGGDVVIGHKARLTFNKMQVDANGRKEKTDWLMHEYRMDSPSGNDRFHDLVLCRIYKKKEKGREDGLARTVEEVEEEEEAERLAKRQRVIVEEPGPVGCCFNWSNSS